jgi:hypothetical protein
MMLAARKRLRGELLVRLDQFLSKCAGGGFRSFDVGSFLGKGGLCGRSGWSLGASHRSSSSIRMASQTKKSLARRPQAAGVSGPLQLLCQTPVFYNL